MGTGQGWKVHRIIPLDDETKTLLQAQFDDFKRKHGREPGPDDLVFPDAPPLEHHEHAVVEAMKKAGIRPQIIYAFEKTGRLVTEENRKLLTPAELDEWNEAIDEYFDLYGDA